jgi:O-acetyl-ADP-ribose deacetylase (regulator of RNase III)
MKLAGIEVEVVKGDITELDVDAIVNAANDHFSMGGGVALAIKKKGGVEIQRQAQAHAPRKKGEAIEKPPTTAYRQRRQIILPL